MQDGADRGSERFGDWVLFGPGKNVLSAPFLPQTTDAKPFKLSPGRVVPVRRCGFSVSQMDRRPHGG